MKNLLLITMIFAVAGMLSACSGTAQQQIEEGLQRAQPTIQAAAQSAGTQVVAGLQTAAPTIEAAAQAAGQAAGTGVASGVQTAAPTLVAVTGALRATVDRLTVLGKVWEWQGTTLSDGTERVPTDPAAYSLNVLVGDRLAIQADCNTATGSYLVDGEALSVTLGATTLATCPEGSLSEAFLEDIAKVGGAMLDGDNLILTLEMDAGIMTFAPAAE